MSGMAVVSLGLSGCAGLGKKKSAAANGPVLVAPKHIEMGRILSYEAADKTAVIEFVPWFRPGVPLAGTKLIARKLDTLAPTARLVAAPYQNNRTLGAYVESGTPGVEDEVVIDPESALPDAKASEPAPAKPNGRSIVVIPAKPEAPKPRSGGRR